MEFVKKNVMQVCHRLAITKDDKNQEIFYLAFINFY